MQAAVIHRFGGPDAIALDDIPVPEPGNGELLIRVNAASVNPVDYKIRQGGFLPEAALPLVLGRDVAGTVERAVSGFGVGEAVFAMLDMEHGASAVFAIARPEFCARKPEALGFPEAAALGLAGLTAWQGLFDHGGLREGQRVLVHGAAGGVGHLAVQFAVARGAEVYGTCAQQDTDFVQGLGATAIDYAAERFEERVHEADVVFDLIGGQTQARSWSVLRPGGIIVSTLAEPDRSGPAAEGKRGVHYMAQPDGAQLGEIAALVEAGRVRPTVARVMPLAEIAEAHRMLEHGHIRGKLVLQIG